MKRLCLLLAVLANTAHADERCTMGALLNGADWLQTRQIAKRPDEFYEKNILLGRHPSQGKVNGYFAVRGAVLYTLCENDIGGDWFKYIWLANDASNVAANLRIGLQVRW